MITFRTLTASLIIAAVPFCAQAEENFSFKSAKAQNSDRQTTTPAADGSSTKKKPTLKNVGNANCPVGGSAVGAMQAGSHIIYKGYKVGLCCDSCKGRFMQDPEAYLQKALGR